MIPAVVMAAGLGTRMRPLTDRYAKPVLPIGGRPVIAQLLRDLSGAGCPRVTVVVGHLGEQVRKLVGDGSSFGLEVRWADQPSPDGSADAVRRALEQPPYLVLGADKVFTPGDVGRVAAALEGPAGVVGVEPRPGTVQIEAGLVVRVFGKGLEAAPLWGVGRPVHERLCLDDRPWELMSAFQAAIDAGEEVAAIEIGATRDLTTPLDVLEENFPYLSHL